MVSEELVKIYLDHLKHFHFSKDLQNQETVEKRRNRERGLQLEGYYLLSGGLKSLYVFELDTHLKKHSLPYKKKIKKNEKIGLNNKSSTRSKGTGISDNESTRPVSFTS